MKQNILNIVSKRNWILGQRKDPFLAYNFVVEIDGVIVAGFNDVSGLSIETQVERKSFGGENHKEHVFFMQTKYSDITLKHGMTGDYYMWEWYEKVINGQIERHNGSIYLLDHSGNPKIWWDFMEACPIKWEGPVFNATTNAVAAETLVLTHSGLYMHK
jgi:phage tail-like protein